MMKEFVEALTVGEILEMITILISLLMAFFALYQWRIQLKIKRAEFAHSLHEQLSKSKEAAKIFYQIEYGTEDWYKETFHKSDDERDYDRLLAEFSFICYLRRQKLLRKRDFEIFEYEIQRVLQNRGTEGYLYNLYHFTSTHGLVMPFKELYIYAAKYIQGKYGEEFLNSKSEKYPHYLNF